ncbi:hypothetical protein [Brucella sp. LJL56]
MLFGKVSDYDGTNSCLRCLPEKMKALAMAGHSDLNNAAKNAAARTRIDGFSAAHAVAEVIKNRMNVTTLDADASLFSDLFAQLEAVESNGKTGK